MRIVVAGAGISGLVIAHELLSLRPELDLQVYESSNRCGGKAWTDVSPEGYRCEWGVNGFLDNKPDTLALCRQLDLAPLHADERAALRFVYRHGRLHPLPQSPPAFLTSRLLSLPGRLRVIGEALVPGGDATNESLREFALRRLGREGFEALIDPMASGVFAGDPARMSLVSCFPRIHELEQAHGSLIRAMIRLQREARKQGRRQAPSAGPGGTLTSFEGGISDLIGRLAASLGDRIHTGEGVVNVARDGQAYLLELASGRTVEAGCLVLAIPAWAQAGLLARYRPEVAALLAEIEYPPLSVVCLGYRASLLKRPPAGFGFLVPGSEGRGILGTVIDSNVFPGRAPADHVLLRVMLGGSRFPQQAQGNDEDLLGRVQSELSEVLGMHADPDFVRIYRHTRAIPQYHVGHAQRLAEIERLLVDEPRLQLAGNAFRGVSLNDCVANGYRQAAQLLSVAGMAGRS